MNPGQDQAGAALCFVGKTPELKEGERYAGAFSSNRTNEVSICNMCGLTLILQIQAKQGTALSQCKGERFSSWFGACTRSTAINRYSR